jgi:hypothetical protein
MLKNEQGLDINLFAGAVRLRKRLDKKGLSEEQLNSRKTLIPIALGIISVCRTCRYNK